MMDWLNIFTNLVATASIMICGYYAFKIFKDHSLYWIYILGGFTIAFVSRLASLLFYLGVIEINLDIARNLMVIFWIFIATVFFWIYRKMKQLTKR